MKEDQPFYVGQKAFIEKDGQVLTLMDPSEGLDFPGGKIQIGESDFSESLKREVREESGLEISVGKPFFVWHIELPAHHRNSGKKIFLVGFQCTYVSGEIRLSEEHSAYRWVSPDTYQELDDGSDYFQALREYFGLSPSV